MVVYSRWVVRVINPSAGWYRQVLGYMVALPVSLLVCTAIFLPLVVVVGILSVFKTFKVVALVEKPMARQEMIRRRNPCEKYLYVMFPLATAVVFVVVTVLPTLSLVGSQASDHDAVIATLSITLAVILVVMVFGVVGTALARSRERAQAAAKAKESAARENAWKDDALQAAEDAPKQEAVVVKQDDADAEAVEPKTKEEEQPIALGVEESPDEPQASSCACVKRLLGCVMPYVLFASAVFAEGSATLQSVAFPLQQQEPPTTTAPDTMTEPEGNWALDTFRTVFFVWSSNQTAIMFWTSIGIVLALVMVFTFEVVQEMIALADTRKARSAQMDSFFYSLAGSIIYGHYKAETSDKAKLVLGPLSDTAFKVVLTNLLRALACDYSADNATRAVLVDQPGLECWVQGGEHVTRAVLAFMALYTYIPFKIFVEPVFSGSTFDETETGRWKVGWDFTYSQSETIVEFFVIAFAAIATQASPTLLQVPLAISSFCMLLVVAFMFYRTVIEGRGANAPSNNPYFSLWRGANFLLGTVSALSILFSATEQAFKVVIFSTLAAAAVCMLAWRCFGPRPNRSRLIERELSPL